MADADQAQLVFDDFLTDLRRLGFDIGVDHYLRLQELLNKVGGECAPQDLKTILAPIFATNKAQQEQFHRVFDSHFHLFQAPAPAPSPSEGLADNLLVPSQTTAPARRRWLYALAAAGLVLLVSLITWRLTLRPAEQTTATPTPSPTQQPQTLPTQQTPQPTASQAPASQPTTAPTPEVRTQPNFLIFVFRVAWSDLFIQLSKYILPNLIIVAPLVLFLFYDQPLQGNKLKSKLYARLRPVLFWITLTTQLFFWGVIWGVFHTIYSYITGRLGFATVFLFYYFTLLTFFLFYRQTSQAPALRPRWYERYRTLILLLSVLASIILFFHFLFIDAPAKLYWATYFAPLLFFLIYEWHRYKRRQLLLQKQRGKKPPFVWPIRLKAFAPRLFDSELFYQAARQMRRRQADETYRLDIEATVNATTESLGYPTFRYKLDTRPPEYLLLIDRASFRDHQAQLFNELAKALEREGIYVVRYFYDADPRVCCDETGTGCLSLLELHSKFAGHRLLVFGDGEKLLDPITGALAQWTTIFADWTDRALLTPTPPAQWGFREISLAHLFLVLPASLEGLLTLVTHFESLIETDVRSWRARGTETVPSLDGDQTDVVANLRAYLGEPTFQWLCACAVYPELQWDLTLYLGALPSMGGDLIREQNLLRLIRLPWFRAGSIPDETRWLLLRELDPEKERAIRLAIIELLERDPPPAETYAADTYQLNLVIQRWLSRRDRQRRRELLDTLQSIPQQQLIRDYTLLRFLEAAPSSVLNLYLPIRLRQTFYQNGIPIFGLKTAARLLLVIAIIGAGLVTREYGQLLLDSLSQPFVSNSNSSFLRPTPRPVQSDDAVRAAQFNRLGVEQFNQRKYRDAEENFRKATELNQYNPSYFVNLGNSLRGQNKLDEATEAYSAALRIDPSNQDAQMALKNRATNHNR